MRDYFHRLKMGLAGLLGSVLLRLLGMSLRIEESPRGASQRLFKGPGAIIAFWHSAMLVPAYVGRGRGVQVLVSQHTDGEYIARAIRYLGFGVVRGSTTRGGARAVIDLMRQAEGGRFLAITPDGPRGPREVVQPGVIYLSEKTALPIQPIGLAFSRAWQLPSWDRFCIPKPFSRVALVFGEPIRVPTGLKEEELEGYRQALQEALKGLSQRAEAIIRGS